MLGPATPENCIENKGRPAWRQVAPLASLPLSGVAPTGKPGLGSGPEANPEEAKLLSKLEEFVVYLDNNRRFIVNYGARYRHGEPIASVFFESAVNQVVSKRFVKRQQMAWRPRHAHNLLQIRTTALNNQLRVSGQWA